MQINRKLIMFILIVSLLGMLYGALGGENACLYKAEMDCHFYTIVPNRFPGNEEELQNACSHLNRVKQCIIDSANNCSAEDVEDIEEDDRLRQQLKDAQRLINVTSEICRECSALRANYISDMLCYQEIFDTNDREQHCRDYTNNAMNYIRSRVNTKLEGREEERNSFRECLHVLFDVNCFLEKFVEKCSSRAKDTAIEIMEIGGSLDDQCPVPIRIDILELLDTLKLVTRRELHVRQLLETNSFLF